MSPKLIGIVGSCAIGVFLAASCGGRTPLDAGDGIGESGGSSAGNGGSVGTGGTTNATGGASNTGGTLGAGGTPGPGGGSGTGGFGGIATGAGGTTAKGGGGAGGTTGVAGSILLGGAGGMGGTPTGGSFGTGGVPVMGCSNGLAMNEELVDNMNDGDAFIPFVNGRVGAWSTYHDTLTPDGKMFPDGRFVMSNTNDVCHGFAAHTIGGMFTSFAGFSAGLGGPYNASAFRGLSFWAMSATSTIVLVAFPDVDTDPSGARCDPNGGAKGCYDHWGAYVTLDTRWVKYTVLFASLRQQAWGNLAPFRSDAVYSVQFNIASPQNMFDVWIDDVALVR
jgi:hypothetical protein